MTGRRDPEFILGMKIPEYILTESAPAPKDPNRQPPACPVLVFVNSKSGGQLGAELLKSYRVLLNQKQVIELSEDKPDKVLHMVLNHLEKLKEDGDEVAGNVRSNLKIIVAGGDGTAGWLLGVVGDLKIRNPPPIATVPLGTGNNLPYSFGWGKKNPGTDLESVKNFLRQVYRAKPMNIDSWHIVMKMEDPVGSPLEPIKLPHSLHPFSKVSESDSLHEEGSQTFRGGFWNYFSIGMDAEVAYEFDRKRQENPEKFKNQLINQGTYAKIIVTQGWFLANCTHPSSRNINELATIKIQNKEGHWRKLAVSNRIRSIVMLNLPSFSGGLNPWGTPNDKKSSKMNLTPAFVNDGLIEIVGFRDGWHGLALLTPKGHGTRLAQAHKVRIKFHEGSEKVFMRMDGEPWLQPLPKDDSKTVIEITCLGQAVMLTTEHCIAHCVPHEAGKVEEILHEIPRPFLGPSDTEKLEEEKNVDTDSDQDISDPEESELRRKFGAADTFRKTDE